MPEQQRPGAGLTTDRGIEPDPRVSTWHEWVRVSRDQYIHWMSLPLGNEVAQRFHAQTTANLVPHLIAQLEHSWEQFEVWLKWWRDQYREAALNVEPSVASRSYTRRTAQAIDDMLDDLREHLAEGLPLHKPCGPHVEAGEEDRWTP